MSVTYDAPPQQPKRTRGPWVALLVAVVAIGAFAFGSDFETSEEQIVTTTTEAPVSLRDRIPGLTGTVHAIVEAPTGSRYVQWPAARLAPISTDLTVPAGRLNVNATHIASMEPIGDGNRSNLWIGPPSDLSLAVPDVTGFAWHDSNPSRIAATRHLGGLHQLWAGDLTEQGYIFRSIATVPDRAVVEAFGDWGVAVHVQDQLEGQLEVLVMDQFGDGLRRYNGTAIGHRAGATGGIVISRGEGSDPVVGYPTGDASLDLPSSGNLLRLDWPLEGNRIALSVQDGGVRLVRIVAQDEVVAESRVAADALRWSPDGRFIVITTTTGNLTIFDTAVSTMTRVPVSGSVFDAILTAA